MNKGMLIDPVTFYEQKERKKEIKKIEKMRFELKE
jgi:hypothetical protein